MYSVLVIDDDKSQLSFFKMILEDVNQIRCVLAHGGEEGLAVYEKNRLDIKMVLLDYNMPNMDGREVFHKLRALAPELPIVMMSGFGSAPVRELLAEGLTDFKKKPVGAPVLRDLVRKHAPDCFMK